jgi:hypothetical protein
LKLWNVSPGMSMSEKRKRKKPMIETTWCCVVFIFQHRKVVLVVEGVTFSLMKTASQPFCRSHPEVLQVRCSRPLSLERKGGSWAGGVRLCCRSAKPCPAQWRAVEQRWE